MSPTTIQGIGGSPGIAAGKACLSASNRSRAQAFFRTIPAERIEAEIERLESAVRQACDEVQEIRDKAATHFGEAHLDILDVGLMLLRDQMLLAEARRRIREERVNAEWAIQAVSDHFSSAFEDMQDPYLRDRRFDVIHACDRILRFLNQTFLSVESVEEEEGEPVIIVADDLTPADIASFPGNRVAGFVTESGSHTSHTVILAEAFGIPAVVGTGSIRGKIKTGDPIIVDGSRGLVLIRPSREEAAALETEQAAHKPRTPAWAAHLADPAVTSDGVRIDVQANVEHDAELEIVPRIGADGIGLYRSDHLLFQRDALPSEDEQFECYRRISETLGSLPAIIRTFDFGGDRKTPGLLALGAYKEANPALGARAIRVGLRRPEVLVPQLKAILRAAPRGNLAIMFPMISSIEEIHAAKTLLEEAKSQLRREGRDFRDAVPLGILVETPAAALCAEMLAREVDFLCVGTNDLTQYALAVDRTNEQVADLYNPYHPAILRLLRGLSEAADAAGVQITVCGEMAGEAEGALCLLGLGYRSLSVAISKIPEIKQAVRATTLRELTKMCSGLLHRSTSEEIHQALKDFRHRGHQSPTIVRNAG